MSENLLTMLMLNQDDMSVVEQKITSIILDDPKKFATYSLTELSTLAEVSQGSIINFANKFAGGGFPTLKLKVATSPTPNKELFSDVNKTDDLKIVLKKRIESVHKAMQNTANNNDESTLKLVAEKILKAKKVELYGIYRSTVMATDFYYQLFELGIPVSVVSDALTCAASAYMLDKESVVFAISSSGRTKDILDAVKVASSRGAFTIGLTSHKNSPLAKLCDLVLISSSGGYSLSGLDTESRLSQMILTDTICSYLRSQIDETGENYYALRKILTLHSVDD